MPIDRTSRRHWRLFCALFAGVSLVGSAGVLAQSRTRMTPQEQAALKLVNTWDQAWNQKDVQKVASYMAEDVEFGLPGMVL